MATSVTKDGITWDFDDDYTVGQYVNGDYWVLDPGSGVGITAITQPHATAGVDGSSINPPGNEHGYHSAIDGYSAGLNVALSFPFDLVGGDSLVSTISWETGDEGAPSSLRPRIRRAAILTCVSSAPNADDFRPPYCGTSKPTRRYSDLNLALLPALADVANTPSLATVVGWFDGPWLDQATESYAVSRLHPSDHMEWYGREIAWQSGDGALMLCLSEAEIGDKTDLITHYVQLGIDKYYELINGAKWTANGANGPGRKLPILVAGMLLEDADMLDIGTDYPASGNYFGEDAQTFEIVQADVDRTLAMEVTLDVTSATSTSVTGTLNEELNGYAWELRSCTIEVLSGTGAGQRRTISTNTHVRGNTLAVGATLTLDITAAWDTNPDATSVIGIVGYETADIGTAEWGLRHATNPTVDNPSWYADYRDVNAQVFPAAALAAILMDLRTAWNHEPFFDFTDRWVEAGGAIYSPFSQNMWIANRGGGVEPPGGGEIVGLITENFTAADATALSTHNPDWIDVVAGLVIYNNAVGPGAGTTESAYYDTVLDDDQFAQATLDNIDTGSGKFLGITVRAQAGADTSYHFGWANTDSFPKRVLMKVAAGTETELDSDNTPGAGGEVFRLEAFGTTIRALVDGVEVFSVTDATLSSGFAGVRGHHPGNRIATWVAGNLKPYVSTNAVSEYDETTATVGGEVLADSQGTVSERGVCWGTSPNPTIAGDHLAIGSGTGSFSDGITGLTGATLYYVRAYATNEYGTTYGENQTFITDSVLPTVTLGEVRRAIGISTLRISSLRRR